MTLRRQCDVVQLTQEESTMNCGLDTPQRERHQRQPHSMPQIGLVAAKVSYKSHSSYTLHDSLTALHAQKRTTSTKGSGTCFLPSVSKSPFLLIFLFFCFSLCHLCNLI